MKTFHIHKGSRFVAIFANDEQGPFNARLFVNCKNGVVQSADATLIHKYNIKTLAKAKQYADKVLASY